MESNAIQIYQKIGDIYDVQGGFLTGPPNFQYQNENVGRDWLSDFEFA